MKSPRRFLANRKNSRASTGPRTQSGKAKSRGNARRHGLAIPVFSEPTLGPAAENLVQRLVGVAASPEALRLARRAASAQLEVVRCRQARCDIFDPGLADPMYWPPHGKQKSRRDRSERTGRLATGPEREALLLVAKAEQLKLIDRYEQRALSRRNRAIEDLDTLRIIETLNAGAVTAVQADHDQPD